MLLAFNERLGIEPEQFAELAQEQRGALEPDRRLEIRPLERLAQPAAELAIEADVHARVRELADIGQMAAEREDHPDFSADPLDQAADLGEIGRHVEAAVHRADQIDLGAFAFLERAQRRDFLRPELRPQPGQRAVARLPLILVDRARQEALDIGAFGRDAAADHLGDRSGHDDRGQIGVERRPRALHRAFGAVAAELLFAEARDDDRQFVRGKRVGVVQDRSDGKVLAADRAVDDHLQSLDRGEGVDRPPVPAGAIMIEDERHGSTSIVTAAKAGVLWPMSRACSGRPQLSPG